MNKKVAKQLTIRLNTFYKDNFGSYPMLYTAEEWEEMTIDTYEMLLKNKVAEIVASLLADIEDLGGDALAEARDLIVDIQSAAEAPALPEVEKIISWIYDHETLTEDFEARFNYRIEED